MATTTRAIQGGRYKMNDIKCHFEEKEPCTDKCKDYKTCAWSEYKQQLEEEKKCLQ